MVYWLNKLWSKKPEGAHCVIIWKKLQSQLFSCSCKKTATGKSASHTPLAFNDYSSRSTEWLKDEIHINFLILFINSYRKLG